MKTLDRYLCRSFLTSLVGVLFIISLVILIAELRDIYGDILAENPEAKWIIAYLAMVMPGEIARVVPLATAVAVLWTLMRLSRQNELLAFFCGGLSPARVSAPFLGVAFALSAGLFLGDEVVLHRTESLADFIFRAHIKDEGRTFLARGTRVYQKGAGRRFYSMDRFDPVSREMFRPTIVVLDDKEWRPVLRIEAYKAQPFGPEQNQLWRFYNAYIWRFSPSPDNRPISAEHKDYIDIKMENDLSTFLAQPGKPSFMTFSELLDWVRAMKRGGQSVPQQVTELHLKIAFPMAPLVVTLLVCSFALHAKAGKAFVQFGAGIVLVLAYYLITLFLRKLGQGSLVPPAVAAWTPNVIFLLLGGQWFVRHSGVH